MTLLALSMEHVQYLLDRKSAGRLKRKYLNVLQGDKEADEEVWYQQARQYRLDGWSFAGGVGTDGGPYRIIRRLLTLRDDGLLGSGLNWVHLLKQTQLRWAPVLTAMQRGIQRSIGAEDFKITYDSSTPYQEAGKRERFVEAPALGPSLVGWHFKYHKFPTTFGVATAAVPLSLATATCTAQKCTMCQSQGSHLDAPLLSPIAQLLTIQDLLERKGNLITRRGSVLADEVLINHNVFTVVEGIIRANDLAIVDPYRAATHNKGVMNGVDAVALATGNDWRALEAAAHAYAARGTSYTSLTSWSKDADGNLVGSIEMPMKVGIVGGPLQSNPTVALNHHLLGAKSARELAEVMGAVGLAQNFSALRALVTDGIQHGHMHLHARSVAIAAGATAEIFDAVVRRLQEEGEIKIWRAQQIVAELRQDSTPKPARRARQAAAEEFSAGHGKVILLGEHAVVYGRHAIAGPVPLAIRARVQAAEQGIHLVIPRWGIEQRLQKGVASPDSFQRSLLMILETLGIADRALQIEAYPCVPRAMGLGGSAALAVAVIRALDSFCKLNLGDERICALAFQCERIAHGTPSGIDNTVATFGRPLLYQRGDPPTVQTLTLRQPLPLVIGMSGTESLTARMVARVHEAWERNRALYERIFDEIDTLTLHALEALRAGDTAQLGELMNICQGQLNALQVSCSQIEQLVQLARDNGAAGAKLTGGGGGGSVIALCPDGGQKVVQAMQNAGYQAMEVAFG
ncbi:MAG: mevalonate kinase [Xanthomonadales bacterium]|nr:mevalonate kinase [Xanthomonadales bacterium]